MGILVFMNLVDETERKVLLQDLKRLDAKKESLTKQLKETNQEIDKLEKKLILCVVPVLNHRKCRCEFAKKCKPSDTFKVEMWKLV